MITPSEIEGIEARLAKATPGPKPITTTDDAWFECSTTWFPPNYLNEKLATFYRFEDARFFVSAPTDIRSLLDRIKGMEAALKAANVELSALIPRPRKPSVDEWPCENPGDRECLQKAFTTIRAALTQKDTPHG